MIKKVQEKGQGTCAAPAYWYIASILVRWSRELYYSVLQRVLEQTWGKKDSDLIVIRSSSRMCFAAAAESHYLCFMLPVIFMFYPLENLRGSWIPFRLHNPLECLGNKRKGLPSEMCGKLQVRSLKMLACVQ